VPLTSAGISAGLQVVGGLAQTLFSGRKKNQAALDALKTPTIMPNKAISDYYQTALNRYYTNPFQSNQYLAEKKAADSGIATGIGALQDRRSGLAGIPKLIGLSDDAMNKAGTRAVQEQNQRFGQLGSATQMKAGDDRYDFQINKLMPYQKELNTLTEKAAGSNQRFDAGLTNLFGGLSNASYLSSMGKKRSNSGGNQTMGYTPRMSTEQGQVVTQPGVDYPDAPQYFQGNPLGIFAKKGLTTIKNPKGSDWSIAIDLKDQPSHEDGGVNIDVEGQPVNAEGKELVLRDQNGETAIIPKHMRSKAMGFIKNKDKAGLNKFISNLPSTE
jgi:hypothetical protein